MRHLSSYTHSLYRLYHFRDRKMERAYKSAIIKRDLYLSQSCYLLGFCFSALNCFSYWGSSDLHSDFWINVAGIGVSLLCFINACLNPLVRRHPVEFHFMYNSFMLACSLALANIQPVRWLADFDEQLVPTGYHLFLTAGNGTLTDQQPILRATLSGIFGRMQYGRLNNYIFNVGVLFCIHGLRGWMFVWLALSASILITIGSTTGAQGLFTILDCTIQQTIACGWVIGVSLLLEREQRQKFLAEVLLERQMHASTTADSILNHMLKNTLSDGVAHIELFLAGCAPEAALHDGVHCLRRGMRACRERQVYLKLVAGEYLPVQNDVNLREFGDQLVVGRAVRCGFLDATVLLDGALMGLILDNALSNAFKHGSPEDPDVAFSMEIRDADGADGTARVEFVISNAADPRMPVLTPEAFARVVDKGDVSAGLRRTTVLSDGIGLAHCALAAEAAGCTILLQQADGRVEFRAALTVPKAPAAPDPPGAPAGASHIPQTASLLSITTFEPRSVPSPLRFFILDDSAASRRILEHQLQSHCPAATVTAFGASEEDLDLFVARASEEADVVIVDQHLEYSESYLGTALLKRLRLMGFGGLMCVRSGDNSEDDVAHYAACGAHCFLGKDLPAQSLLDIIISAYHTHIA